MDEHKDSRIRERTEGAFGYVEDLFYVAVAVALAVAGVMLLVTSFMTSRQSCWMAESCPI